MAAIVETPFGGVRGSGYGRERGTDELECYTVAKNVSVIEEAYRGAGAKRLKP